MATDEHYARIRGFNFQATGVNEPKKNSHKLNEATSIISAGLEDHWNFKLSLLWHKFLSIFFIFIHMNFQNESNKYTQIDYGRKLMLGVLWTNETICNS